MLATTTASYLEALNPEQRRAVEHGITSDGHVGAPLLVIAGAGSGKTNTLAHRVAHLIVKGADPRRILLMTFSRRAAAAPLAPYLLKRTLDQTRPDKPHRRRHLHGISPAGRRKDAFLPAMPCTWLR